MKLTIEVSEQDIRNFTNTYDDDGKAAVKAVAMLQDAVKRNGLAITTSAGEFLAHIDHEYQQAGILFYPKGYNDIADIVYVEAKNEDVEISVYEDIYIENSTRTTTIRRADIERAF